MNFTLIIGMFAIISGFGLMKESGWAWGIAVIVFTFITAQTFISFLASIISQTFFNVVSIINLLMLIMTLFGIFLEKPWTKSEGLNLKIMVASISYNMINIDDLSACFDVNKKVLIDRTVEMIANDKLDGQIRFPNLYFDKEKNVNRIKIINERRKAIKNNKQKIKVKKPSNGSPKNKKGKNNADKHAKKNEKSINKKDDPKVNKGTDTIKDKDSTCDKIDINELDPKTFRKRGIRKKPLERVKIKKDSKKIIKTIIFLFGILYLFQGLVFYLAPLIAYFDLELAKLLTGISPPWPTIVQLINNYGITYNIILGIFAIICTIGLIKEKSWTWGQIILILAFVITENGIIFTSVIINQTVLNIVLMVRLVMLMIAIAAVFIEKPWRRAIEVDQKIKVASISYNKIELDTFLAEFKLDKDRCLRRLLELITMEKISAEIRHPNIFFNIIENQTKIKEF